MKNEDEQQLVSEINPPLDCLVQVENLLARAGKVIIANSEELIQTICVVPPTECNENESKNNDIIKVWDQNILHMPLLLTVPVVICECSSIMSHHVTRHKKF
ncbi:hypothetical protein GOODEAATRI_002761 [Goodea atripinnis]|uniref:Uncharacterized protein n=1 Tax=Goodea atripinnis TaxID=208336 RepID=A0ABV0NR84_9TELE